MARLLSGSGLPPTLYGTARRDDSGAPDVLAALRMGYAGVDTAGSTRFHDESADGQALSEFLSGLHGKWAALSSSSRTPRDSVFVQTKYVPPAGQTAPWPYDIADDTQTRVYKSVLRSAARLGAFDVIDAYFLNAPLDSFGETAEAWVALERIVDRGGIRYLGIANVGLPALRQLYDSARIKPQLVQNWFRASTRFDSDVVRFCCSAGITYQPFGVFDADNAPLLDCEAIGRLSEGRRLTKHQALLRMLLAGAKMMGLQLCILDGSRGYVHMEENLAAVRDLDGINELDIRAFLSLISWK